MEPDKFMYVVGKKLVGKFHPIKNGDRRTEARWIEARWVEAWGTEAMGD